MLVRAGAGAKRLCCVRGLAGALTVRARLCAAAAYMVAAGHEERNRDDHCQRMLEMAKVRGNCIIIVLL